MAIYREDGWKAEVEILRNKSDTEWERYKLKVIKTIKDSAIVISPQNGHVFECEKKKGVCCGGMWDLELTKEESAHGIQQLKTEVCPQCGGTGIYTMYCERGMMGAKVVCGVCRGTSKLSAV